MRATKDLPPLCLCYNPDDHLHVHLTPQSLQRMRTYLHLLVLSSWHSWNTPTTRGQCGES
jgi:hypothetical protein